MYYDNTPITFEKTSVPYINQTRKYVAPMFKFYGDEFLTNLRQNQFLMTAIQDYGINKSEFSQKIDPHVYFLFDVNGQSKFGHYADVRTSRITFSRSLVYFQEHKAYVTDYTFDSNLNGHLHVIVLRVPPAFDEKFNHFLQSRYSHMYTEEEINKYFIKEIETEVVQNKQMVKVKMLTPHYCVVKRVPEYFDVFKDKIKEEFGTIINKEDGREYDFPIYFPNEILRYSNQNSSNTLTL